MHSATAKPVTFAAISYWFTVTASWRTAFRKCKGNLCYNHCPQIRKKFQLLMDIQSPDSNKNPGTLFA